MADLNKMFNPDSVAVVGASNSEGKVGYIILNNICCSRWSIKFRRKSRLYYLK